MATLGAEQPVKVKEPPPMVTVNVRIPKGHKMYKSVDLGKLRQGHSAKVNLSGNVQSVGQDRYSEEKTFEIEVHNLDFGNVSEEKETMGKDLAQIRKERVMNYKKEESEGE